MNLRQLKLILLILSFLGLSAAANAQIGIYGTFDASRFGSDNSAWLYGPTFGFYDNFLLHHGPIRLGADVRGEFVHSGQFTRQDVLIGGRLAVHPPVLPIKPYLQAAVGFAHSKEINTGYSTNPEYRVTGGVDYTLLPRIDWRVIEIGGGQLLNTNSGSNSILTISTGIVFRLP